ncbi:MAG: Rieske (2Fe-2S) protein [Anaerolineae bacterium]|jgi:nitrite reductase/ring-hydroxylating ferredoxin subunit|nr:Rieske (2Fe-2S) protein [Chloroflexota bacterium]
MEQEHPTANSWHYVLDDSALQEGEMTAVYPLGLNIVLARVDGALYALAGACAHMGCPLYMGTLDGFSLVCPCHDWRFDIRTGRFRASHELGLRTYPVKAENGKILVNLA